MTNRKNKKGFTLAELLVVVAIIAILVAVSVPIFTAQLRKAKVATDQANARAAKSSFVAYYLDDTKTGTTSTVYYDADAGTVVPTKTTVAAYGKTSDATADDKIIGVTSTTGVDLTKDVVQCTYTPATGTTEATMVITWVAVK